jgi:hypothetical protein
MSESKSMPAIENFPLIWRWTSPTHALFSKSELAGLHPCLVIEAARIHDNSRLFDVRDGLDKKYFRNILTQSADVPVPEACAWLRAQEQNLNQPVILSWDRETALRTSWEFFTAHWDDFCYPLSDDVLVLPENGGWVLRYHHEEIFFFGIRRLDT